MSGGPADFTSPLNPATVSALRLAGWHPGRHLDVSSDIQSLEAQGYTPSAAATEFLASFQGLKIGPAREDGPNFLNGEPFFVDAVGVGARHQGESSAIASAMGGSWFPIGWWLSYSHVFMRPDGALAAYANGLIWSIGSTPGEGLDLMVSADRPLICVQAPPGMKPWPRGGSPAHRA
ncbi:SUKH-3 domain-containing protein [Amycolatopsis rhabdoformis]|uniref:SUKH-3 domain-containing protein n=1 Tax=Amycolatopsis rhabdoformis TaxID=1448059 RepID=A0ABZ1I6H5_9PSEU|nr:SUKH-3 domain-containing protein [Amycolatopsis rhabdoformis]WSE29952.1 SUKH-3 domain-containing protein [Amycolatopsis rhabdoformis]